MSCQLPQLGSAVCIGALLVLFSVVAAIKRHHLKQVLKDFILVYRSRGMVHNGGGAMATDDWLELPVCWEITPLSTERKQRERTEREAKL